MDLPSSSSFHAKRHTKSNSRNVSPSEEELEKSGSSDLDFGLDVDENDIDGDDHIGEEGENDDVLAMTNNGVSLFSVYYNAN